MVLQIIQSLPRDLIETFEISYVSGACIRSLGCSQYIYSQAGLNLQSHTIWGLRNLYFKQEPQVILLAH